MPPSIQSLEKAFSKKERDIRDAISKEVSIGVVSKLTTAAKSESQLRIDTLKRWCKDEIELYRKFLLELDSTKEHQYKRRLKRAVKWDPSDVKKKIKKVEDAFNTQVLKPIQQMMSHRSELTFLLQRVETMRMRDISDFILRDLHHQLLLIELDMLHYKMEPLKMESTTMMLQELRQKLMDVPSSTLEEQRKITAWMKEKVTTHLTEQKKFVITSILSDDQLSDIISRTSDVLGALQGNPQLADKDIKNDMDIFKNGIKATFFENGDLSARVQLFEFEKLKAAWNVAFAWFMENLYSPRDAVGFESIDIGNSNTDINLIDTIPNVKTFQRQKYVIQQKSEDEIETLNPKNLTSPLKNALDIAGEYKLSSAFRKGVDGWIDKLWALYATVVIPAYSKDTKPWPPPLPPKLRQDNFDYMHSQIQDKYRQLARNLGLIE